MRTKADVRSWSRLSTPGDARARNRNQLELTFGIPVVAHVRIVNSSIDQDVRQRLDDVSSVGRPQYELMEIAMPQRDVEEADFVEQ